MSETVNSGSGGPHRFAEHNVVATFDGPDDARAALVMLERRGVEAGDIELFGPGMRMAGLPVTNDEQRGADVNALVEVERRGIAGGVIGAVVGALIGGVAAALLSGSAGIVAGSAVAGAIFLGAIGFLWGGFSGMGVSEQWAETFESEGGETSVAVHSDDADEVALALEALRSARARRLAMCGRDGQLREVA